MISVMKPKTKLLLILITITLLSGCKRYERGSVEHIKKVTSAVYYNRLVNADNTPGDWLSYGRNYAEDRYSSLEQITKDNIKNMGLAWSLSIGTTLNGIETTPVVVDGIMYFTGPWSKVYAVNAVTGQLIWTYDPKVPGYYGEKPCCDVVNRGVALFKGKVFVRTIDGRLISVDAATGKSDWEILTVDTTKPYTITGAPRIIDDKVIIGNGGAELGVRGYVTAYDAS